MSKSKANEVKNRTNTLGEFFYSIMAACKQLKKHIVLYAAIVVLFVSAALGGSVLTYKPVYKTFVTFSITPLVSSDASSGTSVYKFNFVSTFAQQMSKTFPYIAESDNLREAMQYDLGKKINATITARPVQASNIFQVSFTSSSAKDSYDVMKSFLKKFPQISEYILGDTRIKIIYESEMPTSPYNSPNHARNAVMGLIMGLLAGFIVFYIWAIRTETVHDKNDIVYKLNSKCICELPHVNIKRNSKNKSGAAHISFSDPAFREAAGTMRKRISSLISKDDKVIAVTSTAHNEGKTVTAFNLAKAFAAGGNKTLLIDMDLSRRALQAYLLKTPGTCVGISEYADSKVTDKNIIGKYKENFDIVFAGNRSVKYTNRKIKEFFNIARDNYDYIIVDMPSCKIVPDSAAVADLCDNILFTVKCDDASISDIKNALKYVLYSKAHFIGFVINDYYVTTSSYDYAKYHYYGRYKKYGYSYKYGYRDKYGSKYNSYFDDSEPAKKQLSDSSDRSEE